MYRSVKKLEMKVGFHLSYFENHWFSSCIQAVTPKVPPKVPWLGGGGWEVWAGSESRSEIGSLSVRFFQRSHGDQKAPSTGCIHSGGQARPGSFLFSLIKNFKKDFIYLLSVRWREEEREKHQCVRDTRITRLSQVPNQAPDWESSWQLFRSQASAQSTEPHQPGPKFLLNGTHVSLGEKTVNTELHEQGQPTAVHPDPQLPGWWPPAQWPPPPHRCHGSPGLHS